MSKIQMPLLTAALMLLAIWLAGCSDQNLAGAPAEATSGSEESSSAGSEPSASPEAFGDASESVVPEEDSQDASRSPESPLASEPENAPIESSAPAEEKPAASPKLEPKNEGEKKTGNGEKADAAKDNKASVATPPKGTPSPSAKPTPSAQSAQNGEPKPDNAGSGIMGKIKSISGNSITVYIASAPGHPGEAPPKDGKESAEPKEPFSAETQAVIVTDGTKIVSVTFENEKRTETAIKLAGLKAGAFVMIELDGSTQNAKSIALQAEGQRGPGPEGRGPAPSGAPQGTKE
ncbi:hypothetical protein ACFPVX_11675 [Cohnella faecalis]|uniref:DUF5666 domain-containing protein n=1 Tax=Cohnella faecalis TaxID=2315694 RepID=A0A398CK71_9BACL|nr:hypothetical protein [Cohnella faecalis]RIE03706.1 hypothetical protein D3H35_10445 [Cohnella faecalis]